MDEHAEQDDPRKKRGRRSRLPRKSSKRRTQRLSRSMEGVFEVSDSGWPNLDNQISFKLQADSSDIDQQKSQTP